MNNKNFSTVDSYLVFILKYPAWLLGFIDVFICISLFIWAFPINSFMIHCEGTELVVYGTNLASSVGLPQFNKMVMSMISLPPMIKGMVIGLLLGDAWVIFGNAKLSKNARLGFAQSFSHFPYFWQVFTGLAPYCFSYPALRIRMRFGILTTGLEFFTRSLPCFTELYFLFYVNGIKVIPAIIYELLTPIALAH